MQAGRRILKFLKPGDGRMLTAVLSHVIGAVVTSKRLRSQAHLTHLSLMMLSLLSGHHRVVMLVLRWMLKGVRAANDWWSARIGAESQLRVSRKSFQNFLPILLSWQSPVRHVLVVLHLLLLLLLLDRVLLLLNLRVVIALANVNPSVRIDENLLKNSSKDDFM